MVHLTQNDVNYTYTYNDQGIRTSQHVELNENETYMITYILDGSLVLVENINGQSIYYTYDANGSVISMSYQGHEYFYIKNLQGDIIELVDINGNTVAKYVYDAYGNTIYQWGNSNIHNINPYRYRGYRYDKETGLYYLQSRYYDSSIGRFLSADSINYLDPSVDSGLNLYAYCGNNPVIYLLSTNGNGVATSPVGSSDSSLFNQVLTKGSFQGNGGYGEGSVTFLYREGQGRFEWKIGKKDDKDIFQIKIGYFEKISLINASGRIGFGSANNSIIGLKGIADVGTVTGFLGIAIESDNNYYFVGVDIGASVITGRLGLTLGNNIEIGLYGEALGVGGKLGIIFKDGELSFKGAATFVVGGGVYIRIKFW